MKLHITESRRNKIVTKYLDKYYSHLFVKKNERYDVKEYYKTEGNGAKVFVVDGQTLHIVNGQLIDDLTNLFGVEPSKLDDIFIPWFEETYGDNIFRCKIPQW